MARPRKKKEEEAVEQVAEAPVDEEPVAEEPAPEEPATKAEEVVEVQETGDEGETERLAAVAEAELVEAPAAEPEPAVEEPVGEAPVSEEPDAEEPVAEEPVAEEPEPVAEPPQAEGPPAPPTPARTKRRSPLTRAEKRAKRAARAKPAPRPRGERKPIVRLPKPEHARGRRKERRGIVVSSAMDKTIVVRVETLKPDRRYKKVVRRSAKFLAHDERNEANVGDVVRIVETRPLSKTKNWRLAEVLQAAK